MKTFASREKDWMDVRMTIARQGTGKLDWSYIRRQLAPLLQAKEQPELLDRLEELRRQYHRQGN